jgi:hypothetical protein
MYSTSTPLANGGVVVHVGTAEVTSHSGEPVMSGHQGQLLPMSDCSSYFLSRWLTHTLSLLHRGAGSFTALHRSALDCAIPVNKVDLPGGDTWQI